MKYDNEDDIMEKKPNPSQAQSFKTGHIIFEQNASINSARIYCIEDIFGLETFLKNAYLLLPVLTQTCFFETDLMCMKICGLFIFYVAYLHNGNLVFSINFMLLLFRQMRNGITPGHKITCEICCIDIVKHNYIHI